MTPARGGDSTIVDIIGFEKHLSTELCKTRIISLYMKK